MGRCPEPSVSSTPEPLLPPDPDVVVASSSGTRAGPAQASTTPFRFPPLLRVRAPVLRFCLWRHNSSSATMAKTTINAISMGTSNMPLDPWRGDLVVKGSRVDSVNVFVLETGVPLATLELSTELVAMVAGSPCVSLEDPRDPVAMVTGRLLVLEFTVVARDGPLVSSELVVTVSGGALVPLKVDIDATVLSVPGLAIVTGGLLATFDVSGGTGLVTVTGESLATFDVSGSTGLVTVTGGSLTTVDVSGSSTDVLPETS